MFLRNSTILMLCAVFSFRCGEFKAPESKNTPEPIQIRENVLIAGMSLEELISKSNLIVLGEVISNEDSRWSTSNGERPANEIVRDYTIFTDQIFFPKIYLKGSGGSKITIRHFSGKVGQDEKITSNDTILDKGQEYLIFLFKDTKGATASINPVHFIVLGSTQGIYEISEGKAVSFQDEWLLEDLIAYIQTSLKNQQK